MSIFNQLKGLFIVEDNESESKKSSVNKVDSTANKSTKKGINNTKEINSGSNKDTEKFVNILFSAIEKNNIEGFDYLEYIQSINNLKKQGLESDEEKLFSTAFALSKTMNVDKKALIKSANFYLKVLEKENINFNESLNNNAKVKLQEKNNALNKIQAELAKNKEQLELLKEKIVENEKKAKQIKSELDTAAEKVKSIKGGFNNALSQIAGKIESDKSKIDKYLK